MANTSVYVDVIARDRASAAFAKVGDSAEDSAGKFGKAGAAAAKFGKVAAAGLAFAGVAAGKLAADAIGAASDMNETLSKSQVIFGKQAPAMEKWAAGAARSAGLSKQAALSAASGFGDMFSQLGFGGAEAAKMSKGVVQLSADLGSFNNLETSDVAERMSAAFRGEYDSLQALIPNINAARVEQEALARTGKRSAAELTAQEKAAATLAIVQKDGARASGDFARTSGGLANQQKILKAQLENTQASIGTKLLPVAVKLATFANDKLIPAIGATWKWLKEKLGPVFGAVGDAIKRMIPIVTNVASRVTAVFGKMSGDSGVKMAKIRDTIRDAMTIIRGVFTGTVAVLKNLWSVFGGTIVSFAKSTFKNLSTIIGGAFNVIRGVFKVFASLFKGDWKGVWAGIKLIVKGAVGIITGVLKQAWNIIKTLAKLGWDAIKATIGRALGALISKVTSWAKSFGNKIWDGIKAVGSKLRTIGTWIWSNVYPGPLLRLSGRMLGAAKSIGGKVWSGITSIGGTLRTIGSWAWDKVKGSLDRLRDRFTSAGARLLSGLASGLRNQWDKVKDLTKKPLNLVIDVAINPFIRAVNKLPGVDIPRVPGFAGGGWTGPGSRMQPAGIVHADEFVINKRARGNIERRAPGFLDWLNRGFASGGRVWPLAGGVTSTYAGHSGVDLNAPNDYGKPVHAVTGGTASGTVLAGSYGRHVNLYTASGVRQIYAHLSGFGKMGRVNAGDVIGYVGSTGNSTGPHLHFEVRPGGTYASALAYLQGASSPKGGGGLLGSIFGKFKDGAAWFKDKVGNLLPKVKGGGLFSSDTMRALAKHVMEGIKSKVPGFATGGMVKASPGGSLIRVGEGGMDEAIVPLGRRRASSAAPITINLNIQGSVITERDLMTYVARGLDELRRSQGQRTSILKVGG